MAQTAYSINIPAVSYPGQLANLVNSKIQTALAVAAALPYGTLVVRDTANTGSDYTQIAGKSPAASTDITVFENILGIAVADQARAQDPSVALAQYPQFSAVPCMFAGDIWVQVENAVTAGDPVYVRYASSINGSVLGAFRDDSDTISSTAHAALLPNAVYKSTALAAGFAVVGFVNP